MTIAQAQLLSPGVHRLFWKSGGWSVVAVGVLHDGRRWFAPCNWTARGASSIASVEWRVVKSAERLAVFPQARGE